MYLNYHHLRCFAAVVEEEGIVPASKRLGVSHPTVSEQIHKLEDQLQLTLFERRGRRLRLTDDGRMIYGYAAQIFGVGSALLDAAEGRRTGRTVVGRIGVDSVLAKLIVRQTLSPIMDALGTALQLRCIENERENLFDQLRARQLDIVLTDSPAHQSTGDGLQSHMATQSPVAFFAHRSLRLKGRFPELLDGAPFLLPMPTTRLRREIETWMSDQGIHPHIAAEIEDSGLIKAFGQEGRGVFVMPSSVRNEVVRQYDVQVIGVAKDVEVRVYAITRREPPANGAVAALFKTHELTAGAPP